MVLLFRRNHGLKFANYTVGWSREAINYSTTARWGLNAIRKEKLNSLFHTKYSFSLK